MPDNNNSNLNRYSEQDVSRTNELAQNARSLTEELKDQLGVRSRLNETERETLNLARQLQRSAQDNTVELGNQGNIERQLAKDKKLALSIERELADLKSNASLTEIQFAEKIAGTNDKINAIQTELANATGARAEQLRDQLGAQEDILKFSLEDATASVQRLALGISMSDTAKDLIVQRQKEAAIQKDINEKMGVTGAVVKGTGALMERLGMRSGIFNDAMNDSQAAMRTMAEESTRVDETTGEIEKNHSKGAIALKGASILAKGFRKALLDPAVIAGKILNTFLEINKTQAETQRLIGESAATMDNALNTKVASLNDVMKQVNASTEELGMNAQAIFSSDTLASMAEGVNMLGLTGKQATDLGIASEYIGVTVDQYTDGILRGADAGNKLAKSAVAPGVVLKATLKTADDIKLSLGQSPEAIGQAVTQAKSLGMELGKIDDIASGLLEFESSIEAELEAQLLTGKQINLNKAREYAMSNNLAGVAEELAKNGASAAEFANMSRFAQEGLAKSMGMGRQELAKMIILQDKSGSLTDAERAKVLGMNAADLKRMDIKAKINKLLEKTFSIVSPILDTFVTLLDNSYTLGTVLSVIALSYIPKLASGFMGTVGAIGRVIKSVSLLTAGKAAEAGATLTNTAATTTETAAIGANTAARFTLAGTMKAAGKMMGGAFRAIGKGLGSFGTAAAPAVPILLSIAAVAASIGIAAAGIGFGFKMASDGVVNLMNNMSMEKLAPLVMLGPALFGIAGGLLAIAGAGIVALPAIMALTGLGLVAPLLAPLAGMFGGEDSDGGGMENVEKKLDQLISIVKEGGDVYLDGSKVGEITSMNTYKLA